MTGKLKNVRYTTMLEVMASPEGKLIPGKQYVVSEIQDDADVVVEGYKHPGRGLYWTEFELKN